MKILRRARLLRLVALSPDGHSLVFARARPDGKFEVVTSSPPGANPKPLADVSDAPSDVGFSPDGQNVAVATNMGITILSFPSGRTRAILKTDDQVAFDWLPDSRHMIYAAVRSSAKEAVLVDTETTAARVILRSEDTISEIGVSPDGSRMAYSSGSSDTVIAEVSLDSGAVRPLRATRIAAHPGGYSPSGDQYVYADQSTGRSEIMLRDVAGPRITQLTFGNPVAGTNANQTRNFPRFAPDGRRIAFTQSGQIWTIPTAGGQPVPITPVNESAGAPAWSPDSRWISSVRNTPENGELMKIDSAGQGPPVRLCDQSLSNNVSWFTRWSATGQIAYAGRGGIRICGENETTGRLLVPGAVSGDFNRKGDLFFALRRDGEEWKLLTAEVSSGRILRAVDFEESPGAQIRSASLHPDGKRLAYTRSESNFDIWLLEGLPRPATGWMKLFRHWIEP